MSVPLRPRRGALADVRRLARQSGLGRGAVVSVLTDLRTATRHGGAVSVQAAEGCPWGREVAAVLLLLGQHYRLTPVLLERLIEMASGYSNAEIAARHDISLNTVKTEVAAVLGTLHLKCRHQVEMLAEQTAFQLEDGGDGTALAALRYHLG